MFGRGSSKLMMKKPAFSLFSLLGTTALLALSACESGTNSVTPDAGGTIDSGGDAGPTDDGGSDGSVVSTCPKPTGGPTDHQGVIAGNETWTADKSPHIVKSEVIVTGALTIEPCAEVLLEGLTTIKVDGGKLVATGGPTTRIRFAAKDAAKPFAQLRALNGGTLRFAYTDIENGGHPQVSPLDVTGTVYAQGDQTQPTQGIVFVDHVTMKGSMSNGVYLETGAGFADGSRDFVVTGSASFPVSLSSRAMGTVPSGTYTGNKIDEILIPGDGGSNAVQEDTTMHNRGVPYRIGNSATAGLLTVHRDPGVATLTIEPGTVLRFKKGGHLIVDTFFTDSPARGALVAVGTPAQPIVFTSAEAVPAAGDWVGISFRSILNPADKIENARVEYAGGLTSTGSSTCNLDPVILDAAIRVGGEPPSAFVKNTTIAHSAAHGVDRGWQGDVPFDFIATNTFTNVAACKQTLPRPNPPATCPVPAPCPK